MYFPYLTLRGEEKEAIKDTICQYSDNKIIPILVPYCENESNFYKYKTLVTTVKNLIESHVKFVLIINSEEDIETLKTAMGNPVDFDNYCIRGYFNDNSNLPTCLSKPSAILYRTTMPVDDNDNILYHIFLPYVLRFNSLINRYPNNKKVKIEDAFICHRPNSNYPDTEDFNSELVFTYHDENLAGFGDYTILEQGYQATSGSNANLITHVLHLTKKKENENKLEVYHYLTTPSMEPDNRRRNEQTIAKAYNDRNRHCHSKGIEMIEATYPNHTSLARLKRIGIIHHIEVIHSLI